MEHIFYLLFLKLVKIRIFTFVPKKNCIMIQRIQSLFLLTASILSVIIVVHPISSLALTNKVFAVFNTYGLMTNGDDPEMLYNTFPVLVLAIVTALLNLTAIFLFKKRILQMRVCVYNILLTIGLIISIFIYYLLIRNKFDVVSHAFSYSAVLPFVNIILIFQAFRGIRRDDLLLKSYNRLRD